MKRIEFYQPNAARLCSVADVSPGPGEVCVRMDYTAISAGTYVYSTEAGKLDSTTRVADDVHITLVFGKDAYGVIDLDGGALQTIIKGRGSAGTDDPLDQRATAGAKVMGYTATILNDLWLLRIEHGVSA